MIRISEAIGHIPKIGMDSMAFTSADAVDSLIQTRGDSEILFELSDADTSMAQCNILPGRTQLSCTLFLLSVYFYYFLLGMLSQAQAGSKLYLWLL